MGFRMPAWFDIESLDNLEQETDLEGLKKSAETVFDIIETEIRTGIPSNKIIIGGFSQGNVNYIIMASQKHESFRFKVKTFFISLDSWIFVFYNMDFSGGFFLVFYIQYFSSRFIERLQDEFPSFSLPEWYFLFQIGGGVIFTIPKGNLISPYFRGRKVELLVKGIFFSWFLGIYVFFVINIYTFVICLGAALALYCALHYEKPLAACIALSTFFPETRLPDPKLLHNKGVSNVKIDVSKLL